MADAGEVQPAGGSVPEIVRWLLLWGSDPGSGLCRVELLDPEARKLVVEKVRAGLAERGIALFELALPRDREPEEKALWLARELRALTPGVVSISGFAAVLPSGPSLGKFLQTLNYQREQLTRPELRQIWWMEVHIGQEFTRQIPDLDSWFQIRLSLTEVLPRFLGPMPSEGNPPKVPIDRPSTGDLSPREARALLAEAKARIEHAAKRGLLEKGARRSLDRALRELRRAGADGEAGAEEALLKMRYPELWATSPANPETPSSQSAHALPPDNLSFVGLSDRLTRPEKSLLTLLAHLGPEPIPLAMLEENEDLLREAAGGDPRLEEALDGLERISLLSRGISGNQKTIQLHPLVQAQVLGWTPMGARPVWAEMAIRLVLGFVPEGDPGDVHNWPVWEMLRPHAARVIEIAEEQKVGEPVAALMSRLGQFLQARALFAPAEHLLRQALAVSEASLGKDHPTIAGRLNNLAVLLRDMNRLDEAEALLRRALSISEASLDADHPTVAISLNNLAILLKDTNRLEEAEPLMRRTLSIDEARLGKGHPAIAIDLNNLALLLKDTNRLEEAELLLRRALSIDEANRGKDHPAVAIGLNNLAILLQATNRLEEAEPLLRRALQIDEASLGRNHPNVSVPLINLAHLLKETNRSEEAEPLLRRALVILEGSPEGHPWTSTARSNLEKLLRKDG